VRGIPSTKRGIVINHGGMANYTMTPVLTHPLPKADMAGNKNCFGKRLVWCGLK
jgi:hypothetical protein